MSKQRELIPLVVGRIAECGVAAGLILGGSVRYGYERSDSDLDFFAIGDCGLDSALAGYDLVSEKNECMVLETRQSGVVVNIGYWSKEAIERILARRPYMMYPVLDGELVYDQAGIATRYIGRIRLYFQARPHLMQAWKCQMEEHRRFKVGKIARQQFPEWSDFLRHLEETGCT